MQKTNENGNLIKTQRRLKRGYSFFGFGMMVCFFQCSSLAQHYPAKPIKITVGFSPGGIADVSARLLAPQLAEILGQSVVIENRPGASGAIATEKVSMAAADGYTLLAPTAADTVIPALRKHLPYNLERDLSPVALVAIAPFILVVHPSVPVTNVKELIALARLRPGKLSYGSVGLGTTPHLSAEALKVMATLDIVHIPYKGGLDNVIANASGAVDMVFASLPSLTPMIGSGHSRLKPLAVTSIKRASFMPQLPTMNESGVPGYDRSSWVGILAPKNTSKDIISKLNAAIITAANNHAVKDSFNQQGLEPQSLGVEQFGLFIKDQLEQNVKLIAIIGLKKD